jgi:hypothetical protein
MQALNQVRVMTVDLSTTPTLWMKGREIEVGSPLAPAIRACTINFLQILGYLELDGASMACIHLGRCHQDPLTRLRLIYVGIQSLP